MSIVTELITKEIRSISIGTVSIPTVTGFASIVTRAISTGVGIPSSVGKLLLRKGNSHLIRCPTILAKFVHQRIQLVKIVVKMNRLVALFLVFVSYSFVVGQVSFLSRRIYSLRS
jgi:hypothetical protein